MLSVDFCGNKISIESYHGQRSPLEKDTTGMQTDRDRET
jgi:hypothetical protein